MGGGDKSAHVEWTTGIMLPSAYTFYRIVADSN